LGASSRKKRKKNYAERYFGEDKKKTPKREGARNEPSISHSGTRIGKSGVFGSARGIVPLGGGGMEPGEVRTVQSGMGNVTERGRGRGQRWRCNLFLSTSRKICNSNGTRRHLTDRLVNSIDENTFLSERLGFITCQPSARGRKQDGQANACGRKVGAGVNTIQSSKRQTPELGLPGKEARYVYLGASHGK